MRFALSTLVVLAVATGLGAGCEEEGVATGDVVDELIEERAPDEAAEEPAEEQAADEMADEEEAADEAEATEEELATEEECELACIHYGKLGLAEDDDLELGSAELEASWAELEGAQELERGLDDCVRFCEGSASSSDTDCILESNTLAEAGDCSGALPAETLDEDE